MFPENKNYTLGKGKVYFGRFADGTRSVEKGGLRYLGNTPEFNLATDSEDLPHYDADNGVRIKDDSVTLEVNRTGSLITDHISPDNIALWFGGTTELVEQAILTDVVETIEGAHKGMRYQIGKSPTSPNGVRGITVASVTDDAGTPVPLVPNVDYQIDAETGGLRLLAGGTVVVDGTTNVVVTYSGAATSYHRVSSGGNSQVEGELFFEATNPKGAKFDYLFPYCQLRPDGDFALKGDEWQQISFSFEALKLDDQTESVYTNGRPGVFV